MKFDKQLTKNIFTKKFKIFAALIRGDFFLQIFTENAFFVRKSKIFEDFIKNCFFDEFLKIFLFDDDFEIF